MSHPPLVRCCQAKPRCFWTRVSAPGAASGTEVVFYAPNLPQQGARLRLPYTDSSPMEGKAFEGSKTRQTVVRQV